MKIDNEVLAVISTASVSGNSLVLNGQLDRKMYERTNKVIEAAGGKWNRSMRAHVFATDATERVEQIMLTGEVEVPKDEFNYFPSPPAVVARLLELAEISPGEIALEPSAGQGAIAIECARAGASVHCIELMDENFVKLTTIGEVALVMKADFLSLQPNPMFDIVVMNPPFAKQADIDHVLHAHKFLKPEGRLVSVMASSVTFRDNKKTSEFRQFIYDHGGDIEALPENSFKQSGTAVNTVIVTIPAAA